MSLFELTGRLFATIMTVHTSFAEHQCLKVVKKRASEFKFRFLPPFFRHQNRLQRILLLFLLAFISLKHHNIALSLAVGDIKGLKAGIIPYITFKRPLSLTVDFLLLSLLSFIKFKLKPIK